MQDISSIAVVIFINYSSKLRRSRFWFDNYDALYSASRFSNSFISIRTLLYCWLKNSMLSCCISLDSVSLNNFSPVSVLLTLLSAFALTSDFSWSNWNEKKTYEIEDSLRNALYNFSEFLFFVKLLVEFCYTFIELHQQIIMTYLLLF